MRKKLADNDSVIDLERYRLDGGTLSMECLSCPLLAICKGETRVGGTHCARRCVGCGPDCTLVCLGKPESFIDAVREVGWFAANDIGPLVPPAASLPTYIPMIPNRSSRSKALEVEWAAVPLRAVVRRPRGVLTPIASTPEELREKFLLGPKTRLVLVGIDHERHIEPYWRWRSKLHIPELLARLGLEAAIVPNYSFDLSHPRPQHLHNRKRSLICAREWSAQGIPSVPYLQAVGPQDYDYWLEFLAGHPEISVVAREFQTGGARPERGLIRLDDLSQLQDKLKRRLHLIAVGAAQYRVELSRRFDTWTIIDSTPFFRAVRGRRKAMLGEGRVDWPKADNESPDSLLPHDINVMDKWIANSSKLSSKRSTPRTTLKTSQDEKQLLLFRKNAS